jgi:plastocyanin
LRRSRSGGLVLGPALAVALALGAFAALGAGTAGAGVQAKAPTQRHRQAGPTVTVTVGDNFFKPSSLEIAPGTKVKWVNKGRNLHNVAPDKGKLFGIDSLPSGKSYSFTFNNPGKYPYYCTFHGAPGTGMAATITVTGTATGGGGGGAVTTTPGGSTPSAQPRTIKVPADSPTIQGAVDKANPGDLVLVSPGTYKEAVTVSRPNIVIRGVDRNTTILEGSFQLSNGFIVTAPGVALENMTARDYQGNGFYWTGVDGYRGSYLTAYRNGDYGIYAFNSTDGLFEHSYASGSPDSGFYIGQCNPCNAVINDVVSEYNELGYSGTNASGQLFVVNSVWRNNRTGIAPNTLDSEQLAPQGNAVFAANRVYDNQSAQAAHSNDSGFDTAFGTGIAVIGGNDNIISKNLVLNQTRAGIVIAPNPGISTNKVYESTGNKVTNNIVRGSGIADIAVVKFPSTTTASAASNNCFSGNKFKTSKPEAIEKVAPCSGSGTGDFSTAIDASPFLDTSKNPTPTPYQQTPVPKKQPNMRNPLGAKAVPATSDKVPGPLPDLTKLKAPKNK